MVSSVCCAVEKTSKFPHDLAETYLSITSSKSRARVVGWRRRVLLYARKDTTALCEPALKIMLARVPTAYLKTYERFESTALLTSEAREGSMLCTMCPPEAQKVSATTTALRTHQFRAQGLR